MQPLSEQIIYKHLIDQYKSECFINYLHMEKNIKFTPSIMENYYFD